MSSEVQSAFLNWLFDRNLDSDIPYKEDILRYDSPISNTYVISLFNKHLKFNYLLDKYFNNIGIRSIDKMELFLFIKKAIIDFKISKYVAWSFWPKKQPKLFYELQKRFPILKPYEIDLMIENIKKSGQYDNICATLKISEPIIEKTKHKKMSLSTFLSYFSIQKIEDDTACSV